MKKMQFAIKAKSYCLVSIVSTSGTTAVTHTGGLFLPKTPEAYSYDADGNLTQDGRFSCTWDGENRLVKIETRADVIAQGTPGVSMMMTYDWMGRRVKTQVKKWSAAASQFQAGFTLLGYYDGWNLIGETLDNGKPVRSYIWGLDLSGSLQGAGGVGGLLRITDHTPASPVSYSVTCDGNGNVLALWNTVNGQNAATYRYGPFGEVLQATGLMAGFNPFRFSTKYEDFETGLDYYGYRYYNASTGRWLSRDPITEKGGANLYNFCINQPSNNVDALGRVSTCTCEYVSSVSISKHVDYDDKVPAPKGLFGHSLEITILLRYAPCKTFKLPALGSPGIQHEATLAYIERQNIVPEGNKGELPNIDQDNAPLAPNGTTIKPWLEEDSQWQVEY